MNLNALEAISPVDGRYRNKVEGLKEYFSEFALIKYRIRIEIEYFISLCMLPLPQLKDIDNNTYDALRSFYKDFSVEEAQKIKEIEKTTNHDVKAIEYYLKQKFDEAGLSQYKEFIHFALTSQDVNNTAVPLSIKDALHSEYYPLLGKVLNSLKNLAEECKDISMLAHTHGQPASPTKLGKELRVFVERLEVQLAQLKSIPFSAKFGGATGNFNAHKVAFPEIDCFLASNQLLPLERPAPRFLQFQTRST